MIITELWLKNYGQFHNQHIRFGDGIQLIEGTNESGKSTVHTFIRSMLFGLERGRGRAANTDTFRQYEPWADPKNYAGDLEFLCGGKRFHLQRQFDRYSKCAQLYCVDDGEELSVGDGDLYMLLGGLTPAVYDDTISIGQMKVEPTQTLSGALENYANNIYASGGGELDVEAAVQSLKLQRKEIDQSLKERFREKQEKREHTEQEASFIWREIHKLQDRLEELERDYEERKEIEKEKKKKAQAGNFFIDDLRQEKWRVHPLEILFIVAVSVMLFLFVKRPWNAFATVVYILLGIIYIWNRMKIGKKPEPTAYEQMLKELSGQEPLTTEHLQWEITHMKERLKERQVEYNNLREQLEEFYEKDEADLDAEKQMEAIRYAMEKIEEISEELRKKMEVGLNRRVSEIVAELTDGKYTRVVVEGDNHISLISDGRRIALSSLSRGTIEQIYFALRMAAAELLCEERYPIILDDAFVHYDDERLLRTLRWLEKQGRQVLLFTCQGRERYLLEKAGISYQFVELAE